MRVIAVIPARYASTRLAAKPLCDICGKPMIQHVYERARTVKLLDEVLVATDDMRIMDVVSGFGGKAVMTSPQCASGTDRLLEVAHSCPADIYINIQGDEPLLEPAAVEALVRFMLESQDAAASLCFSITAEQSLDPATVKVVRTTAGQALYFSRAPIPFPRNATHASYWGHCGIYAFRAATLQRFGELAPSPLEQAESLEQLRLLQAGISMGMVECSYFGPAVDTQHDLDAVRRIMDGQKGQKDESDTTDAKDKGHDWHEKLRPIRLVIADVDGVLTDGGLYYGANGETLKRFHARDGLGIRMLQKAGIQVAVISGRDCPALRARLHDLGIDLFRLGNLQKQQACAELITSAGFTSNQTLFVGDDVPDMQAFSSCGLGVAVADAPEYVRKAAQFTLHTKGGEGALRELADALLLAQGYGTFLEQQATDALFCKEDVTC